MSSALIEFKEIKKSFGSNQVLQGVNLSILEGVITAVIGRSGTGKSVLLKHIIGLIRPDAGMMLIRNRPMEKMTRNEKHGFQKDLSYMFQDNALFDFMTVFDNIALPLKENPRIFSNSKSSVKEKVGLRMAQLGLEGIGEKYPVELSGGMRKRVALARALVTDPKIVLFDEPTTGLDPVRKHKVHRMISKYQEDFGFSAVIVSHDIPEIFHVAQRIAMLDKGKIIFEGTPDQLSDSRDQRLNAFIRGREF